MNSEEEKFRNAIKKDKYIYAVYEFDDKPHAEMIYSYEDAVQCQYHDVYCELMTREEAMQRVRNLVPYEFYDYSDWDFDDDDDYGDYLMY